MHQTQPKLAVEEVKNILKNAGAVCFDVDSTVSADEGDDLRRRISVFYCRLNQCLIGIDILAEFSGGGERVAEMTRQ